MPIATASVAAQPPAGAVIGVLQADGTVVWYMPDDELPPSPPAPDMTQVAPG